MNSRMPSAPSSRPKPERFTPAKRQPRIGRDHAVDENHPRFQLGDEKFLFGLIVRPGARAQAE